MNNDELVIDTAAEGALRHRLNEPLSVSERQIYLGADAANPHVGDHRITYRVARPEQISVIGRQNGVDFAPYQTKAGDALLMAQAGVASAVDMFKAAERENTIITWLLRALCTLALFIGFSLILRPLVVLGDVVPFVGSIVGAGTTLIALLLTVVVAPIVVAFAWFYYRPVVAIAVLAGGAIAAFAVRALASRKAAVRGSLSPMQQAA